MLTGQPQSHPPNASDHCIAKYDNPELEEASMSVRVNTGKRGFSLVELLAVVMILGVLAAIAVPIYMNSRTAAAARTCKANIASIAAAEAAFALRNGAYCTTANAADLAFSSGTPTSGGLIGAPEGLANNLYCPLDGTTTYTFGAVAGGGVSITCGNASAHAAAMNVSSTTSWAVTLQPAASETIP
jgi:prepilin-type N-terminal cleavage/methylation domain-containing protein